MAIISQELAWNVQFRVLSGFQGTAVTRRAFILNAVDARTAAMEAIFDRLVDPTGGFGLPLEHRWPGHRIGGTGWTSRSRRRLGRQAFL